MAYQPFGSADSGIDGGGERPIDTVAAAPGFLSLGGGGGDNDSGGGGDFDASIHIGPDKRNADGSYRKKRGRKANGSGPSRSSGKKADNQASVEALTRILTIIHVGIAGVTKTPEMKLEDDEAESLAGATSNVLAEFDIRPDPKIEAIVGLVTVSALIYGPRIYLITERKKAEAVAARDRDEDRTIYQ